MKKINLNLTEIVVIITFVVLSALLVAAAYSLSQSTSNEMSALKLDMERMEKNFADMQKSAKAEMAKIQTDLWVEKEKLVILSCESKFRHDNLWGDNGKSYGIAQFQEITFNELKKRADKPRLKWKNQADQLWLLDWALRNGYASKWTCSTKSKNYTNKKKRTMVAGRGVKHTHNSIEPVIGSRGVPHLPPVNFKFEENKALTYWKLEGV